MGELTLTGDKLVVAIRRDYCVDGLGLQPKRAGASSHATAT
jgi:hypothetical protein